MWENSASKPKVPNQQPRIRASWLGGLRKPNKNLRFQCEKQTRRRVLWKGLCGNTKVKQPNLCSQSRIQRKTSEWENKTQRRIHRKGNNDESQPPFYHPSLLHLLRW